MPYIMAVDLGGTNCRFAGFTLDKGILSLHRMGKRKTAELPDTGALISACGTALDLSLIPIFAHDDGLFDFSAISRGHKKLLGAQGAFDDIRASASPAGDGAP